MKKNKGNTAQFGKKQQPGFLAQFKVWKTKEYCRYFSFFKLKKWGKKTAAARRHNCAVLPKKIIAAILSVTALLTALLLTGCTERTAAEDASADGKRGVYVRLERSDISAIGLRTTVSSLVCENADGSVLHAGEWIFTGGDIAQLSGAENRAVLFTVRAMAKDDTILASIMTPRRKGCM